MVQLGGFLERLFEHLLKTSLLLMKNVLKLLPKSTLRPLGLTGDLLHYNLKWRNYDIVLSKFFFHQKWNKAWLLVISWHIQVASQVVNYNINKNIIKIKKYQEDLKFWDSYCVVLSPPTEMKILLVLAKSSRKIKSEPFPWCAISHEN